MQQLAIPTSIPHICTQIHSTSLPLPALLERTGLAPANLDIVLAELQRAGLLTVVTSGMKHV